MSAAITLLDAAGTVTGSRHLIEVEGRRVVVDCGLYQGLKETRTASSLGSWPRRSLLGPAATRVCITSAALTAELAEPCCERTNFPATPRQKALLARLSPSEVHATTLAGEPIRAVLRTAPGDRRPIGGIKIVTEHGWCAARPSGTEAVCKLYAESLKGRGHLRRIQEEPHGIIQKVFATEARR